MAARPPARSTAAESSQMHKNRLRDPQRSCRRFSVAPAGVEPTMGESKSPALPLGDGALQKELQVRLELFGCRWWGSNPHVLFAQGILSPPRLPFRHTGSWVLNRLIIPDLHHKIKTKVASPGKFVEISGQGSLFAAKLCILEAEHFPPGAPGGTAKEKP